MDTNYSMNMAKKGKVWSGRGQGRTEKRKEAYTLDKAKIKKKIILFTATFFSLFLVLVSLQILLPLVNDKINQTDSLYRTLVSILSVKNGRDRQKREKGTLQHLYKGTTLRSWSKWPCATPKATGGNTQISTSVHWYHNTLSQGKKKWPLDNSCADKISYSFDCSCLHDSLD